MGRVSELASARKCNQLILYLEFHDGKGAGFSKFSFADNLLTVILDGLLESKNTSKKCNPGA